MENQDTDSFPWSLGSDSWRRRKAAGPPLGGAGEAAAMGLPPHEGTAPPRVLLMLRVGVGLPPLLCGNGLFIHATGQTGIGSGVES